ncbi:SCP2 sterol-binding domain-containing protein [Dimargaris cristalligena]|uniref:SCP2 sterol-binding domain-containing protein n=1 Tax=Dimargaris cristalligena TaxID=215637 RepID=A0A4P9ZWR8_9FUNG|nr:SCP2 sterol-binding domain-containing protein [Dimargaris cristalligena]|eukprot:RKP38116.1 SCP2 sterol-binding domain-containing protein [Dimargaris cristalligena]
MLATKLDTLFKTVQELAAKSPSVSSAPAPASTSAPKADAGVAVDGFESSALFVQLAHAFATMAPAERKRAVQGVRGVFQFNIRNAAGQTQTWALDLKNTAESGEVVARGAPAKADIILTVADADFVSIGQGKTSAQGAFLTGKLKLKGNMALAMKLEPVLKAARPKASL